MIRYADIAARSLERTSRARSCATVAAASLTLGPALLCEPGRRRAQCCAMWPQCRPLYRRPLCSPRRRRTSVEIGSVFFRQRRLRFAAATSRWRRPGPFGAGRPRLGHRETIGDRAFPLPGRTRRRRAPPFDITRQPPEKGGRPPKKFNPARPGSVKGEPRICFCAIFFDMPSRSGDLGRAAGSHT